MPPNLTSLSNYSLRLDFFKGQLSRISPKMIGLNSRTGRTLQNGNYYHLGPRPGLHSPSLLNGHLGHGPDSPYHTTLSVPLSQGLQPGYDSAQVLLSDHLHQRPDEERHQIMLESSGANASVPRRLGRQHHRDWHVRSHGAHQTLEHGRSG